MQCAHVRGAWRSKSRDVCCDKWVPLPSCVVHYTNPGMCSSADDCTVSRIRCRSGVIAGSRQNHSSKLQLTQSAWRLFNRGECVGWSRHAPPSHRHGIPDRLLVVSQCCFAPSKYSYIHLVCNVRLMQSRECAVLSAGLLQYVADAAHADAYLKTGLPCVPCAGSNDCMIHCMPSALPVQHVATMWSMLQVHATAPCHCCMPLPHATAHPASAEDGLNPPVSAGSFSAVTGLGRRLSLGLVSSRQPRSWDAP